MGISIQMLKAVARNLFASTWDDEQKRQSVMTFRVRRGDCMVSFMSNDRYHRYMDMGRIELLFRYVKNSDIIRNDIRPFVYTVDIMHIKEMRRRSDFQLITDFLDWDSCYIWLQHVFVQDNKVVALAVSKNGLRSGSGIMRPPSFLEQVAPGLVKRNLIKQYTDLFSYMSTFLKGEVRQVNKQLMSYESMSSTTKRD